MAAGRALIVGEATCVIATRQGPAHEAAFIRGLAGFAIELPSVEDWPQIAETREADRRRWVGSGMAWERGAAVITGLTALALWSAGQPFLGLLLALISTVYHALVYATGGRLLKTGGQRD